MKHGPTLFLKFVLLLIATTVFAGLIYFPTTEGRAADLDLVSICSDPFIIYTYFASVPFFFGFYQAFKLLNLIAINNVFSLSAVNNLKNIKYASLIMIAFITLAIVYIRFFVHGDDPAGPTGLGIFLSLAFGVIATIAGVCQKILQNAVDLKSENDLTV